MSSRLYDILDRPLVYRLASLVLAPGASWTLRRHIRQVLRTVPPARRWLDVGCGPWSYLFRAGLKPTGVDVSHGYSAPAYAEFATAVAGTAQAFLPFADGAFGGVWSIALLHHLPDGVAGTALSEMLRVCGAPGHVVVLDAVLPRSAWRRPLAAAILRSDRGRHMRTQQQLESLLPHRADWTVRRFTYSATGLELLSCCLVKR